MAIQTTTFSGVTLSGKDADVFEKQFLSSNVKPNHLAQAALERERALREEINKRNYAIICANSIKHNDISFRENERKYSSFEKREGDGTSP